MTTWLDEAIAGFARVAWIAGEAGIGKTRLIEETIDLAEQRSVLTAVGRCFRQRDALPYEPFLHPLSVCTSRIPQQHGTSLPVIASLLRSTAGDEPPGPRPASAEIGRQRLFSSVREVIAQACRQDPLLFVLEDCHEADTATLALLRYLAERWPSIGPGLLVCTYRAEDILPGHSLERTIAYLLNARHTEQLLLTGLSPEDVATLIEAVTGARYPTYAPAIFARTRGNPLFVRELARHLTDLDAGEQALAPGSLPNELMTWIRFRISRLSENCQQFLTHAAVYGMEFPYAPIPAFAGLSPEQGLAALDEALARDVVHELADGADTPVYRFKHALFREALYFGLSTPRRQVLHLTLARTLSPHGTAGGAGLDAEAVQHYLLAGEWATHEERLAALTEAIRQAKAVAAIEDTERYAIEALKLVDDDELQASLLTELGLARRARGDWQGAVDALASARDLYLAQGGHLDAAGIDAELSVLLAWAGKYQQAAQAVDRGLALFAEGGSATARAQLLAMAAITTSLAGQRGAGKRLVEGAAAASRSHEDPVGVAWSALAQQIHAICFLDREAIELCYEAMASADEAGEWWAAGQSRFFALTVLIPAGKLAQGRQLADELAVLAGQYGDRTLREWSRHALSYLALLKGDLDMAEELCSTVVQHSRQAGILALHSFVLTTLAETAVARGDSTKARELLEEADDTYRAGPLTTAPSLAYDPRPLLAGLLAREGETAEAIRLANDVPVVLGEGRIPTYARLRHTIALVEALAIAEDRALLPQLYQAAVQAVEETDIVLTAVPRLVARQLAMGAAALGRWAEAERFFDTAFHQARHLGAQVELAEIPYWYGRALVRRGGAGDLARAHDLLGEAADRYARLGMAHHEGTARAALRGEFAGPRPAPASVTDADLISHTLRYDPAAMRVYVDGVEVTTRLTPQERKLLTHLWDHAGEVCSKQALRELLWEHGIVSEAALPILVRRLREKLEPDPSRPIFIINVRQAGYRLDPFWSGIR